MSTDSVLDADPNHFLNHYNYVANEAKTPWNTVYNAWFEASTVVSRPDDHITAFQCWLHTDLSGPEQHYVSETQYKMRRNAQLSAGFARRTCPDQLDASKLSSHLQGIGAHFSPVPGKPEEDILVVSRGGTGECGFIHYTPLADGNLKAFWYHPRTSRQLGTGLGVPTGKTKEGEGERLPNGFLLGTYDALIDPRDPSLGALFHIEFTKKAHDLIDVQWTSAAPESEGQLELHGIALAYKHGVAAAGGSPDTHDIGDVSLSIYQCVYGGDAASEAEKKTRGSDDDDDDDTPDAKTGDGKDGEDGTDGSGPVPRAPRLEGRTAVFGYPTTVVDKLKPVPHE